MFCDDCKSAEIALIDHHVDYEPRTVTGFHGESVEVLTLGAKCPALQTRWACICWSTTWMTCVAHCALMGRLPRGDIEAVRRLVQEAAA